jgi:hypothetical protein
MTDHEKVEWVEALVVGLSKRCDELARRVAKLEDEAKAAVCEHWPNWDTTPVTCGKCGVLVSPVTEGHGQTRWDRR